jgi:hypothetical protein
MLVQMLNGLGIFRIFLNNEFLRPCGSKRAELERLMFLLLVISRRAALLLLPVVPSLTFAVSFTLGADVVAKHGPQDKVLFGRQLVQRTDGKQTDSIETLLSWAFSLS